jgi:hypothetical protein
VHDELHVPQLTGVVDCPVVGVCIFTGVRVGNVNVVNLGFIIFNIKYAPARSNNPISAALIHSFASLCPEGLPAEVIYLTPPYTTTPNARIPPTPNAYW